MDLRRQTAKIGGLVLLACLVQVWTVWRAVVPAQDAVRYLIVAQGIERDGLLATLRCQPEQPLFPALVCLVHQAVGPVSAGYDNWAICLQVAAAIPLILSVIPVHALFCRFHGERAGVVGALLYVLLGGIARLGADGLSDSTHLALFCTAVWAAAHYFEVERPGPVGWLFLAGGSAGLALVARSEAIVVPAAVFGALVWLQLFRPPRSSWWLASGATGTLLVGLAMVLVPYLILSEARTPTDALTRLTGRRGAQEAAPLNAVTSDISPAAIEPRWEVPGQGRLVFGKKDTSKTTRFRGYPAAASKLFEELAQTLHYWLGAAALIGLWTARGQMSSPLDRFMQCLCATLVVAALWVAAHAGYLSTRHVLLLVVLGLGWAGVGILAMSDWTASDWLPRFVAPHADCPGLKGALAWSLILVAIVACGTDLLRPLHATRTAHREAAQWLTQCADRQNAVLDSRGFTALYTGLKTYRYEAAQAAFTDPALTYVVVEHEELSAESRRSETMRWLLTQAGELVASFAPGSEKHGVVVYRWQPEQFARLGVRSYAR
ncbi:MAG TPA: glycosyltransferase family 39 protein [Pirellulales bacterium]|jgi:hypothetical protein|nr:glycosyltransferase family 39 protein [Pirellulales bacterium]